ncbi:protein of unknown function [Pseudotevenvirus RB43]|jgi:regulator of RNase E activity RraA|uniref:Uncharacterized protein n=2 Tax=Pseudotevenvirus RB43 TaxID=115991 RepID=Q56BW1_9CAUD|nr:hypothetical protein RB43ORF087w [Escherichia phage RB43]AAX78609.1 hypothetical protein RB43ORF087w [Escherichia phage RB43]CCK73936.1 protein of unknown function [Pseudotevenvirus RB43]CCL97553.1 protein of unknown function [Pseudotevenvirus RB43]
MKYVLEYCEHEFTEDMMNKMRVYNQNITSITPVTACREFVGYSFTIYTNSEDDATAYLKSINAIFDKFEKVWKVGY